MPKNVYEATLPDGRKATRTTDRTYSHVIIYDEVEGLKQYDPHTKRDVLTKGWVVLTWAGRPDLAEKEFRRYSGLRYLKGHPQAGKLAYKDVRKIPCHLKK
jgi:hypothetical protein